MEADPAWVVPALEAVLVAWEVGHPAVAFVDTVPSVKRDKLTKASCLFLNKYAE